MDLAAQIKRLAKEVGQVAVAASVVGTRREKLMAIAKKVDDLADGFHGSRPEVEKLRRRVRQRLHDVRNTRTDQSASIALSALREVLDDIAQAIRRGIGTGPETFSVGDIEVGNPWGYSVDEARRALEIVRVVVRRLANLVVPVDGLTIVLDPSWSGDAEFALYDREWETIAMSAGAPANERAFANQVGYALWDSLFEASDREAWGNKPAAFALAFGAYITGSGTSADESARLRVTIGRSASKWPERVS